MSATFVCKAGLEINTSRNHATLVKVANGAYKQVLGETSFTFVMNSYHSHIQVRVPSFRTSISFLVSIDYKPLILSSTGVRYEYKFQVTGLAPGHFRSTFPTRSQCEWCKTHPEDRYLKPGRSVLGEVVNGVRPGGPIRPRETTSGCGHCGKHLCLRGPCFDRFHSQIRL